MSFIIGTPHTNNAGYYRNDDTPSGGLCSQADVKTCTHCQKIILMQSWKEEGGWCGRCMAPICPGCADRMLTYGCEPFLQQIEKVFDMTMKASTFRRLAGLDSPAQTQVPSLPDQRR